MAEGKNAKWVIGVFVLLFLGGAVGLYFYLRGKPAEQPAAPAAAAPPQEPPPAESQPAAVESAGDAPRQPMSRTGDAWVRRAFEKITSNKNFKMVLDTEHLVSKLVALVEVIAEGSSPRALLGHVHIDKRFKVQDERNERALLDPSSYSRYDKWAEAFASLDTKACARLVNRLAPELEDSYRQLGRRNRTFRQALSLAFQVLLAVPVVEEPIVLDHHQVLYRFVDPKLEKLSEAQKHLLRMGPGNIRKVQGKLTKIANELNLTSPPSAPSPR